MISLHRRILDARLLMMLFEAVISQKEIPLPFRSITFWACRAVYIDQAPGVQDKPSKFQTLARHVATRFESWHSYSGFQGILILLITLV